MTETLTKQDYAKIVLDFKGTRKEERIQATLHLENAESTKIALERLKFTNH